MPGSQYTMAEMFKDAGYKTAHIGKWHLGAAEDKQPNAQGFDYSFGHFVGCIDNYSHFFFGVGPTNMTCIEMVKKYFIRENSFQI